MTDFVDFRNHARATFPNLSVSVLIYEKDDAMGGNLIYWRLSVQGMSLGAEAVKVEATSAEAVLRSAIRQVARARTAHKQENERRDLMHRAEWRGKIAA